MVTYSFYVETYILIFVEEILMFKLDCSFFESSLNGPLFVMIIHLNDSVIAGSTREGLM